MASCHIPDEGVPVPKVLAAPPQESTLSPISGNAGFPVIGHSLEYFRDPMGLLQSRWDRYGPCPG